MTAGWDRATVEQRQTGRNQSRPSNRVPRPQTFTPMLVRNQRRLDLADAMPRLALRRRDDHPRYPASSGLHAGTELSHETISKITEESPTR